MKLSAILVSITLPVAAQSAAQADEAINDTAGFLKTSLSSQSTPETKKRPKLSLSQSRLDVTTAKVANAVKLRPFMPGRKLPRQRDLELALVAQTPKLASPEPAPLSGQISEFSRAPMALQMELPQSSGQNSSISTYDSQTLGRASGLRTVPGQVPTVPGQVRVMRQAKSRMNIARRQLTGLGEHLLSPSGALQAQAPVSSPSAEQNFGERMSALGYPNPNELAAPRFSVPLNAEIIRPPQEDMQPTGSASGPGPAPFPLSLLPQNSLKELLGGGARNRVLAPPAYFGSWHAAQGGRSGLAPGGFQSHLASRGFSSSSFAHIAPRQTTRSRSSSPRLIAQERRPSAHVAAYPLYDCQPHTD